MTHRSVAGRDLCFALVLLLATTASSATTTGYTDLAGFDAALVSGPATLTDFESEAVGTTYAPGTGPAGSNFTLSLATAVPTSPAILPEVVDTYWTTSGTHYLSESSGDAFLPGDQLTFSFSKPIYGFGMYVLGTQDIQAGDITLGSGGFDISNGGTFALTDGHGSYAYFIGLVSTGSAFTSLTLSGLQPFTVDDVLAAAAPVPEPSTSVLLALGVCGLFVVRKRPRRGLRLQRPTLTGAP